MYSAILMVALSTVGGHKCHGCAVTCAAPACCAPVACTCAVSCSCAAPKKCKVGLFKRLFGKKCHGCSCACDCAAPACCEPACYAPACCEPACSAPVIECPACDPAPADCCTPCASTGMPAAETPVVDAGFRVDRSTLVAASFEDRAEFADEPIVIFARN